MTDHPKSSSPRKPAAAPKPARHWPDAAGGAEPKGSPTSERYQSETAHHTEKDKHTTDRK